MTPGALLEGLGPLILGSQTTPRGPSQAVYVVLDSMKYQNKTVYWGEVIGPCP